MARKGQSTASGRPSVILLVDDDVQYLEAHKALIEREGHKVILATSGDEALSILRETRADLVLLDYFMPGMTGEEMVGKLREFDPVVQVILQTGYASEKPPRDLLQRLDIQGYYDKTEGPDKLMLWTDVGLKASRTLRLLHRSRHGLRYILETTPQLHKIQSLDDLLQGVLGQITGLLGITSSFSLLPGTPKPQVPAHSFIAMLEEENDPVIRAATGRFRCGDRLETAIAGERLAMVHEAIQRGELRLDAEATVMPLRVGQASIGLVYFEEPQVVERDPELLAVFANQVAVAIHNTQLYEMATLDPLTGIYVRGFFDQYALRTLRTAFRLQEPIALLMLDMDNLKQINDTGGHPAGDRALARIAHVLRDAMRGTDLVGRYGGDEFAVLLSKTRLEDAERVAERIVASLREASVEGPHGPLAVRASLGLAVLAPHEFQPEQIPRPIPAAYFQDSAQRLLKLADGALYEAKRGGKGRACVAPTLSWAAFPDRAGAISN